jgi:catechol 2,3-dioxygenase-like lactoylglutathione lyase family enzyme
MPSLSGILETAVHAADLARSSEFYERVLGLKRMAGDERFRVYSIADRDVLLLFKSGATGEPYRTPGGVIPPHGGAGQLHFAFSIPESELPHWERRLAENGVPVESRVHWPLGGVSIYFRDPDYHLLELVTPGVWPIY